MKALMLLLGAGCILAQPTLTFGEIDITVHGALSLDRAPGATRDAFSSAANDLLAVREGTEAEAYTPAVIKPILEIGVDWPIGDAWAAGGGMGLTRSGYQAGVLANYSDPVYQRDEAIVSRETVTVNVFTLPIWLRYETDSGLQLRGGAILGFPFGGERTVRFDHQVMINGSEASHLELPSAERSFDLDDDRKGFVTSVFFAAERPVSDKLSITSGIRFLGDTVNLEGRGTSTIGVSLGLRYRISRIDR